MTKYSDGEGADAVVARAGSLAGEGRWQEAEAGFRDALEQAPGHRDGLLGLSFVLRETGRPFAAVNVLREALAEPSSDAAVHHRLGMTLMAVGRLDESITHFRLACRGEPLSPQFWLNAGSCLLLAGRTEEAEVAFQRAVTLDPQVTAVVGDPRAPFQLRRDVQMAQIALRAKFVRFHEQTLDEVRAEFPKTDLSRLELGLAGLVGDPAPYANARRRAAQLYLPGIPELPWVDAARLPWTEALERHHGEIRRELDALLAEDEGFAPYVPDDAGGSPTGSDLSELQGSMAWNAFHLYKNGTRIDAHCERCPVTVGIFEDAPIPRIRHHSPEIFFSRLQPAAHIAPHHGLMNIRLTLHLGLIIPPNSGIQVDGEARQWAPGKVLAFDDSFQHEAWNRSDTERVVLIFEAWHPAVTPAEQLGIARAFELRRDWLDRFEPDDPAMPR